jgi:small nuclear ribonucleoprotein (snRNP)-like protein
MTSFTLQSYVGKKIRLKTNTGDSYGGQLVGVDPAYNLIVINNGNTDIMFPINSIEHIIPA